MSVTVSLAVLFKRAHLLNSESSCRFTPSGGLLKLRLSPIMCVCMCEIYCTNRLFIVLCYHMLLPDEGNCDSWMLKFALNLFSSTKHGAVLTSVATTKSIGLLKVSENSEGNLALPLKVSKFISTKVLAFPFPLQVKRYFINLHSYIYDKWPAVTFQSSTDITVEPLYCGHIGDLVKCPVRIERCLHFRGKFMLRKNTWDRERCPYFRRVL